jgi:hypothetical protein
MAKAMRLFSADGSCSGNALSPVGAHIHLDFTRGEEEGALARAPLRRFGAKRKVAFEAGRQDDGNGKWAVKRVVDVRRRAGTTNAIDAELEWVHPVHHEEYEYSWVEVNARMMPGAGGKRLREEAWGMWQEQHPSARAREAGRPQKQRAVAPGGAWHMGRLRIRDGGEAEGGSSSSGSEEESCGEGNL